MLNRREWIRFAGYSSFAYTFCRPLIAMAANLPTAYPYDPYRFENFQMPLFVPRYRGVLGILNVNGPIELRVTQGHFNILPGKPSPLLLYQTVQGGNNYLNPIFRIERGARFKVTMVNELSEPTIIHWQGLSVPSDMDGHPSRTTAPGKTFVYDFTVQNRGGTYWYHTHAHNLTAKQAYLGLASFFLVDDDDQRRLSRTLELKLGVTDLPIVLQDKQLNEQGELHYAPNAQETMMGWLGDVIVTNLTPNAVLAVSPRVYRFRLLNGSNARVYRLAFKKEEETLAFTVIGTDGGLLTRAERVKQAFLAPAERLDVLFDAGQLKSGESAFLKSLIFDPMENEGTGHDMSNMSNMSNMKGMHDMHKLKDMRNMADMKGMEMGESTSKLPLGLEFNLIKFMQTGGIRRRQQPLGRLSNILPFSQRGALLRTIQISLNGMTFAINDRTFNMQEIAFEVQRGTREVWSIRNPEVGMPHPIHVHGFLFQVLERTGSPPQVAASGRFGQGKTVSDLGWKDTVLVWPGETVRIGIDFSHDFPGDQVYMVHCHNLEHEDAGMMINFRVR